MSWYEEAKRLRAKGIGKTEISKILNIPYKTVDSRFYRDSLRGNEPVIAKPIENLQESILKDLQKPCNISNLCERYKQSERIIKAVIEDIQELGYDIEIIGNNAQIRKVAQEELEKLDKAIKALGYKDRADWYRDMKRQTIKQAKEQS